MRHFPKQSLSLRCPEADFATRSFVCSRWFQRASPYLMGGSSPVLCGAVQPIAVEAPGCSPMAAGDTSCGLGLLVLSLMIPCSHYPTFLLVAEHAVVIGLCWVCLPSLFYRPVWPCSLLPLKQKQMSAAEAELFCLCYGLSEDPTQSLWSSLSRVPASEETQQVSQSLLTPWLYPQVLKRVFKLVALGGTKAGE